MDAIVSEERPELAVLIGQRFRNLKTGTIVTLTDVTDNGYAWLSNGPAIPADVFLDKWEAIDVPPR